MAISQTEGLKMKAERLRKEIADERAARESANVKAAEEYKKSQLEAEVAALEEQLKAEKAITKSQEAPSVSVNTVPPVVSAKADSKNKEN